MRLTAAIFLTLFAAGCESAYAQSYSYGQDYDTKVSLEADQGILTAENGMTLYTFDNDTKGKSNCDGGCAESWPPYAAKEGDKAPGAGFTMIERADGTNQWAKDGAPLYFWVGDSAPGDTTGDGVGGVWHIVK